MSDYHVRWVIDVEVVQEEGFVSAALLAVAEARESMRDQESTATVFEVRDATGKSARIDLDREIAVTEIGGLRRGDPVVHPRHGRGLVLHANDQEVAVSFERIGQLVNVTAMFFYSETNASMHPSVLRLDMQALR